jgi:hypothetical protein
VPLVRPELQVSCEVGEVGCVPYIEECLDSGGVLRRLERISNKEYPFIQEGLAIFEDASCVLQL